MIKNNLVYGTNLFSVIIPFYEFANIKIKAKQKYSSESILRFPFIPSTNYIKLGTTYITINKSIY